MNGKKNSLLLAFLLGLPFSPAALAAAQPALLASGTVRVAADVPEAQAQRLSADLSLLDSLLPQSDPALQQVMGIRGSLDAQSLGSWLAERVQYIVREDFDPEQETGLLQAGYPFENPGVLPELNSPGKAGQAAGVALPALSLGMGASTIVMQNIGSGMYLEAKAQNRLVGARIAGVGTVPLTSPRAGIVRIGQGMFMPLPGADSAGGGAMPTPSAFFRLMVLFHEARHSDGNGPSAGFLHAYCPLGHDYEGEASCDLALNGAYTLGGNLMTSFIRSCGSCGTADKEALKLAALDNLYRVLKEAPRYLMQAHDLVVCQKIARDREPVTADDQDYCQALLSKKIEMVKAADWNPAPEGKRAAALVR